jgi:hypothetical protein
VEYNEAAELGRKLAEENTGPTVEVVEETPVAEVPFTEPKPAKK